MNGLKTISIALIAAMLLTLMGCSESQKNEDSWKLVLNCEYDSLEISSKGQFVVVEKDDKYGAYVKEGNSYQLKIPIQYNEITLDTNKDEFAFASTNNKIEVLNQKGEKAFEQAFNEISIWGPDNDGFSATPDGVHFGYLSRDGQWLIAPIYKKVTPLNEDKTFIADGEDKSELVDRKGRVLFSADSLIGAPNSSYAIARGESGYGVINAEGTTIIPFKYRSISIKDESKDVPFFICLENDNTQTIIGEDGQIILEHLQYGYLEPWDSGVILVSNTGENNKWGLISSAGKTILPVSFDSVKSANGSEMAVAKKGNSCWLYDLKGNKLSDAYDSIRIFPNSTISDIVCVEKNHKYGFMSGDKKISTSLEYDYCEYDSNNELFLVQKDGRVGIVDKENRIKLDFNYSSASFFYNGYAAAIKDGKMGIITLDGHVIVPFQFDPPSIITKSAERIIISRGDDLIAVEQDGKMGCVQIY